MILQFWLAAILLLIIACAAFLTPFVFAKKRSDKNDNQINRNRLNRDLYEVRVAELEQDEAQGLIVDKAKIITELQYNLLDDTVQAPTKKVAKVKLWLWLPGLLVLTLGSAALYSSVGGYQKLAHWQTVLQRYPVLQNQLFNDQDSRPSEQDLRDIMLGLRTHLSEQKEDADGWLLYSRLAMVFKEPELAFTAVKKAHLLAPKSVDIRLAYIQLQMQRGEQYSQQQAEIMLLELLEEQPEHLEAWSMYAFMALEKEDFSAAIARWQKMLTLVEEDSEQAGILQNSIAYAENKLSNSAQAVPEHTPTIEKREQQKEKVLAETYQVNVSIAANVILPKNGFLFVFAQAVDSAMPIAALKMKITKFPLRVELSDANSMMQGSTLSGQADFIIKARIAKDPNVASGTWQGQTVVIKKGEKGIINLLIGQSI